MKRKNLTTKQIQKASTYELIFRMNCLHAESKRRSRKNQDVGIPITDIWEANTIVKELRRRLGRLGNFYVMLKKDNRR